MRYIESRKSFRAKSTVYGTLSVLRGMGDHLVRESIWRQNPLRWMQGPKVTPYSQTGKPVGARLNARVLNWRRAWLREVGELLNRSGR